MGLNNAVFIAMTRLSSDNDSNRALIILIKLPRLVKLLELTTSLPTKPERLQRRNPLVSSFLAVGSVPPTKP
jgi:hypothetical protein